MLELLEYIFEAGKNLSWLIGRIITIPIDIFNIPIEIKISYEIIGLIVLVLIAITPVIIKLAKRKMYGNKRKSR